PEALWCQPRARERSVVAHTLSKSFGLAGARVGFLHGPEAAMRAITNLQTFATYCASRPMQLLAAAALSSGEGAAWVREARARYAQAGALAAAAVGVAPPESGTFILSDTRPFLRSGEPTSDLLVRCARHGVVLAPGAATGSAYADYARLCFTALAP